MDAQAKKKAAYRAKLNAQKLGKRIDSPLVRYNENDQPVCRVCDVVLKSDSLWPAHQASRKHHEAINNVKANAAAATRVPTVKSETTTVLSNPKPEKTLESHRSKPEPSTGLSKSRPASVLPSDFFDNHENKKQKSGSRDAKSGNPNSEKTTLVSAQTNIDILPSGDILERESDEHELPIENGQLANTVVGSESKQVKGGALPEGFFDDKTADLRARGIKPVKLDVKDEYKEFEKLIQEDLKEVDNRMEEEEFDAAEMIEEAESVEQRSYRERVEMLKRKKMELKAARSAHSKTHKVEAKVSRSDSSSDNDSDEDLTVDWRAKHL